MQPQAALGLWMSSFGAVKISEDLSRGAAGSGNLHGAWTYQDQRSGREVVGYFSGNLRGNVLELRWQEPALPAPLVGSGYLVFDPMGARFSGRWRTDTGDRGGDWSGWRDTGPQQSGSQPQPYPQQPQPYSPYPQQPQPYSPYPQQPQPYSPYPQQPQPRPYSPYPAQPQPYPAQPYPAQPAQPYSPYSQPPRPQPSTPAPGPSDPEPSEPRYY